MLGGERLQQLNLKLPPVGWKKLKEQTDRIDLIMLAQNGCIEATIEILQVEGTTNQRVGGECQIIESSITTFVQNNARWSFEYQVCIGGEYKYCAILYTRLGDVGIIIQMHTNSELLHSWFASEAKRIINSLDLSSTDLAYRFSIGNSIFLADVPTTFYVHKKSSEERLFFSSPQNYLAVNVASNVFTGTDGMRNLCDLNYCSLWNSVVQPAEQGESEILGIKWSSYYVKQNSENTGKGTYFEHTVNGQSIVSFLFERKFSQKPKLDLFKIREG